VIKNADQFELDVQDDDQDAAERTVIINEQVNIIEYAGGIFKQLR
jgi:hypothetical protein